MGRFRLFLANEMNIIPEDAYEFYGLLISYV